MWVRGWRFATTPSKCSSICEVSWRMGSILYASDSIVRGLLREQSENYPGLWFTMRFPVRTSRQPGGGAGRAIREA